MNRNETRKIFYIMVFVGLGISTTLGSISIMHILYAQNSSNLNGTAVVSVRKAVEEASLATITAWASLIVTILTAVGIVFKMFKVDGKAAQALTVGVDAFNGLYDNRAKYSKLIGLGASMTPEEAQKFLVEKVVPMMNQGAKSAAELEPKIRELNEMAAKQGKAVPSINYGKKLGET